ncbi:hypothetical protein DMUE_0917 [Dictyocoela muelleri]|nr:hypothetical protein DMUE_0917 [Dictyocoela muelleri]
MKEIKIIKTQRNKNKFIYDNYIYVFDRENKDCISLRCSNYSFRGRLYTDKEKNIIKIVEHCHEPEIYKIMRLNMNNKLKYMAINTNIPFDEALIKLSLKLSDNELKKIGNINSMRDYYTRLRRMNQNPIIKHCDDILDMYKYTYDGDLFLQDDTGKENEVEL